MEGHKLRDAWALERRQHGVVTRAQLLELGYSTKAIAHRLAKGRLHPVWRGVYAVGRPELTRQGCWMAAVLSCGAEAALSHESAAVLWGIRGREPGEIHVTVPGRTFRRREGVVAHRRASLEKGDVTRRLGIPVTTPLCTLVDLAGCLVPGHVEAAVNEADRLDLVDPERLRHTLEQPRQRPGVAPLRELLDRRTFTLTDSELERRFLLLARSAGLPQPETGVSLNGFKVDFWWPALGVVVETDGLRYHRTPSQQAKDRVRDHAHTAAGLTQLRFTHAQVFFEGGYVKRTLSAVAARL
jgi:very-short-patch-repair endonuclease